MQTRQTFRLFVIGDPVARKNGAASPVVAMAEFAGARAIERVSLTSAWLKEQQRNVADLRSFLDGDEPYISLPRLRAIGQHLFTTFVTGGVQVLLASTRGSGDKELLPCEIFVESGAAAEWPWEFLYDPGSRQFLCETFHPVSRGVFTQTLPNFEPPEGRSLAVLVVLGTPRGDESADAGEQKKAIENVFRSYLGRAQVDLDVVQGLDSQGLAKALIAKQYAIVHYFGHGMFDRARGEGALVLKHKKGESRLYANDFAAMLVARDIQLVFLNACETGRVDPRFAPAQGALASALVDRGIPAVIATQFPMPENGSHAFASSVYQSLYEGESLTCAMREGRLGLRCDEEARSMDWGIPVLYSADPHLKLFTEPKQSRAWAGKLDAVLGRVPSARDEEPAAPAVRAPCAAAPAEDGSGGPPGAVGGIRAETGVPPLPGEKPRTTARSRTEGPVHVALCDIDANAAFLPEIAAQANAAQSYFSFEVEFLPVPAGSSVRLEGKKRRRALDARTLVLSRIERRLARLPASFAADQVCCLTRQLVDNGHWSDLFASSARTNPNVQVVSTYGVREYAAEAGVSFAGAVFIVCLSMVLARFVRLRRFHKETAGCLFDFCEERDDIVIGLKKGRFDHEPCREMIGARDPALLEAVDALIATALTKRG